MSSKIVIDVKERKIQTLMDEVQSGKFFLPSFQRRYEWDEDDIKDLVESIINSYPIGTIILWKPSKASVSEIDPFSRPLLDTTFATKERSETYYIVDGQQRLTSLILLFNEWRIKRDGELISRYPVSYNLANQKFYKGTAKGTDLSKLIKVFCLQDIGTLRELTDTLPKDKLDEVKDKIKKILDYPMPIYIMETYEENEDTFRDMAEAFIRVNKFGLRIGNLELMLSFLAGTIGGDLKQKINSLYDDLYKDYQIDLQPVIRFAFSRFGLKQTQISKVEQFKGNIKQIVGHSEETRKDIFTSCIRSMKLAVQLLKTYLGIKSSELLPSQTVLVPIAAYLYRKGVDSLNQVDEIDKRKIINWFFLASFNGYYSSQTDTKLDRDLEVIEKSFVFPWDDLIANMESRKARTRISFKDLERGLSVNALRRQGRAHLFLLYTLLIRNEADDWTGSLLRETSIDKVARHHIFPREF
ncbi:DUF262 domain-containing protein, partial [Dehalococcoidia bacterium]|nr:DUF262 domain-containing protein [Dehalococcoidia bacterium]